MAVSNIIGQAERDFQNATGVNKDLDKNSFLQLLVTQLQHQDPLNPAEDKDFLAQLAQFTSLEQLTNLNTSMDKMVDVTNRGQLFSAVSYIGKHVAAPGEGISVKDGDASTVYYGVEDNIVGGHINIFDQDGNVVYTEIIPAKSAGAYDYTWDGRDSNGNKVPDGYYYVSVGLENAEGKSVMASTEITGRVTGVESANGQYYLALDDGRLVAFSSVTFVSENSISKKEDAPVTRTASGTLNLAADANPTQITIDGVTYAMTKLLGTGTKADPYTADIALLSDPAKKVGTVSYEATADATSVTATTIIDTPKTT